MAEKIGVTSGTSHELKIGDSFGSKKDPKTPAYHTIRYDFKPASVDPARAGVLQVGQESNSVSVSVPHVGGNGETNYSGHLKDSSQKECVLIIDRETGEITLERFAGHVLLKKTRAERPEKPSPSPQPTTTTPSSSSRPHTPINDHAHLKSKPRDSPASTPKHLSRSNSPHVATLAADEGQTVRGPSLNQVATTGGTGLSESSSDSSSSGSDSDSDVDEMDVPTFGKSSAASAAAPSLSMPSFNIASPLSSTHSIRQESPRPPSNPSSSSAAPSMPQFLNDDLQLSESEDDSDS